MNSANLFSAIPPDLPDELTETLIHTDSVRIERIVSRGHRSPEGFWYDQDASEWVVLLQGKARLKFKSGREQHLERGDYVTITAHCRHRVEWTDPEMDTVWLAVHYDEDDVLGQS